MSQKARRYESSFSGLIGAMIVTVAAVVVFMVWKGLFSNDVEVDVESVEWRDSVELAQSVDMPVVHPSELPQGWRATSVELRATGETVWSLGTLTDDGKFVGLRQQDTSLNTMLSEFVDEDAVSEGEVTLDSAVGNPWESWSDAEGDRAYSIEFGDDVVLVYGSAPKADIEEFISLLTQ